MDEAGSPGGAPPPAGGARVFPIELQLWLSPSFPVGSFAYSHGLEWAAAKGRVQDRATALAWLTDLLSCGSARNDAILLAHAWRAAAAADRAGLQSANELALALAGSRERHLETTAQGRAFLTTVKAAWPTAAAGAAIAALTDEVAYPVAVGAVAAAAGLPLQATAQAYLVAFVGTLVSALVRLSVIGQTDGQRVQAALVALIAQTAAGASGRWTLADLGAAAFVSDIAAMAHEVQDTRLFRS